MATRTDSDCNVGYYGVGLGDLLGEARQIEKPLTLHIAEKDRFSSPEEITKVREALESNGKATTHLYKGQDHAFARPGGEHRSEEHTSELQSLMRISYAVFCLKKKNQPIRQTKQQQQRIRAK